MYLRISQEKKVENVETLANHRSLLEDYCKQHNLTYEVYGEVLSGGVSELEERPQLQRLLNDIEKFDAILVVELSRLSRNGFISEIVLKHCMEYDKPIITPHHTYDLANNNNDVLTFRFGSIIASQEHALIGKRSKANKIQMTKAGMHVSGNIPYGYTRNNKTKKLEINEEQAEVVRLIFKLHNSGLGSYKIRDILNAGGYKSAKDLAFNLPSIKRIIKNEAYRGAIVFNDRRRIKKGGKYIYENVETYVIENAHPAIIEPAVWYKANDIRMARAVEAATTRERATHKTETTILKDLVYCGCCGRKSLMLKDSKTGKIYIKVCDYLLPNSTEKCGNAGIQLKYVTELVTERLEQYKEGLKGQLEQLLALDTSSIEQGLADTVSQLERQIYEQERQHKNLINAVANGILTGEDIRQKKQEITNRLEKLRTALEEAKKQKSEIDLAGIEGKLRDVISTIEQFKDSDPITQNEQLKTFIKKIRYTRDMPEDIKSLSTRNPLRRNFPFEIEIEYI